MTSERVKYMRALSYLSVWVEQREVRYNDRYRQRNGENSHDGAQRADEHAEVRAGNHVTIAYGSHGDDGPPQAERDRLKVVEEAALGAFRVVDEGCEDDDAEDEKEYKHHELMSWRLRSREYTGLI